MIVERIVIENFGPFQGEHDINLKTTKKKPINIIIAQSGDGKTSIVDAIRWALFGEDFEDQLLKNEGKKIKDKVCKKEIFEKADEESEQNSVKISSSIYLYDNNEGKKFRLRSESEYRFDSEQNQYSGTMTKTSHMIQDLTQADGIKVIHEDDFYPKFMPKKLSSYYIIDGDRFSKKMDGSARKEISDGVKAILEIDIFDESKNSIGLVNSELNKEFNKLAKNSNTEELIEDKKKKEIEKSENEVELKTTEQIIKDGEIKEKENEEKLRKYEKFKKLLDQKENIEKEIKKSKDNVNDMETKKIEYISDMQNFSIKNDIKDVYEFIGKQKEAGELPKDVSESLINELCELGQCICGEELNENDTAGKKRIENLKRKLENNKNEFEQRLVEVYHPLRKLIEQSQNAYEQFNLLSGKIYHEEQHLKKLMKDLRTIEDAIENSELDSDDDSIQTIIDTYKRDLKVLNDARVRKTEIESKINQCTKDIDEIDIKLLEINNQNKKLDKANRKKQLGGLVESLINKISDDYENNIRDNVEKNMISIWHEMQKNVRKFYVDIDHDFDMDIRWKKGDLPGLSNLSEGQKQTLGLAFSCSIADLSLDKNIERIFVIDAPWLRVDEDTQDEVAKYVSKLSSSTTLALLEGTEWNNNTKPILKDLCSNIYRIKYTNDSNNEDLSYSEMERLT